MCHLSVVLLNVGVFRQDLHTDLGLTASMLRLPRLFTLGTCGARVDPSHLPWGRTSRSHRLVQHNVSIPGKLKIDSRLGDENNCNAGDYTILKENGMSTALDFSDLVSVSGRLHPKRLR
ncbi:hypothetical protein Mapa_000010 [Marchantia paleacea]|nr:hypothetical protein Mapa_000010 [Marchantia paleacea]